MEFRVTRGGAALIGFWAILAGALVSLPFWLLDEMCIRDRPCCG